MFLYPYKIFSLSKNKRLFNEDNPSRTVGIYDVNKYSYSNAKELAKKNDAKISILLGDICLGTKLICLDLDDCFDDETGEMDALTKDFMGEFENNEWEISSSGTGIHIYILTKKNFETFIVKDMQGCKSFECYTNKRHIVTTSFDFQNTDLIIGKHDDYLEAIYDECKRIRDSKTNSQVEIVKTVFDGTEIKTEQDLNSKLYKRTPVTDMFQLRGLGFKDPMIIECIDMHPSSVDQSAWDAKLVSKLMYYTLSFDSAWEMAKKTNYYKAKDDKHKKKFDSPIYKERTRKFIERGRA